MSTKVCSKNMCSRVLKGSPARNKLVIVKTTQLKAKLALVDIPMCRNSELDLFLRSYLGRGGNALSVIDRDYFTKHI